MRRIDRYWKRCAAGVMAAVTLMLGQGGMQSFAMNAQTITSPNKIIVQDETQNTGSQANTSNQTAVSKAEVVGFGEVSTPVTDSSSYFGKGKLTLLANHDTAAQQLAAIIETGEGGNGYLRQFFRIREVINCFLRIFYLIIYHCCIIF